MLIYRYLDKYRKRSIRLANRDYAKKGSYFVTISARRSECLFGEIREGQILLNHAGRTVEKTWAALPERFSNIRLDAFIVMPNHFHGIIHMNALPSDGAGTRPARTSRRLCTGGPCGRPHTLGQIIGAFKSISSNKFNHPIRGCPYIKLWHRNYYERVIREYSLDIYRRYIRNNPTNWLRDPENPKNIKLA